MKAALIFVSLTAVLTGCAALREGSVADRIDQKTAEVYLDPSSAKAGDSVSLFRRDCRWSASGKSSAQNCKRAKIGSGQIVKFIEKDKAVVQANGGVDFDQVTSVEKE
jgi:hypothetical protein